MGKLAVLTSRQSNHPRSGEAQPENGDTGLGLAISRRFCQMLGGDIRVDSLPGEGSVFTMTLRIELVHYQAGSDEADSAD